MVLMIPLLFQKVAFLAGTSTANEEATTTENACKDYQDYPVSVIIRVAASVGVDINIIDQGTNRNCKSWRRL
jgi:hypothetical protein